MTTPAGWFPPASCGTLTAVLPALASLIALQKLDTAADRARARIGELPLEEETLAAAMAAAEVALAAAKSRLAANQEARRALEKDVAGVDTRMARFEDHKAAVKTNQEFTALLHEIETARSEKDAIEEKILELMEQADAIAADVKEATAALADTTATGEEQKVALAAERAALEEELARLAGTRKGEAHDIDAVDLARYEQLLKGRRGVAVAAMTGETCSACFVRLRPHFTQMVRRNDSLIQCESCQRILFFVPPAEADQTKTPSK